MASYEQALNNLVRSMEIRQAQRRAQSKANVAGVKYKICPACGQATSEVEHVIKIEEALAAFGTVDKEYFEGVAWMVGSDE